MHQIEAEWPDQGGTMRRHIERLLASQKTQEESDEQPKDTATSLLSGPWPYATDWLRRLFRWGYYRFQPKDVSKP